MLKIRPTTGEEGVRLLNAVGTGFEDVDDRGVRDAPMLAVDTNPQSIARRGARDEERAASAEAEPKTTRDDPLDDRFGLIAGSSGKDDGGAASGSAPARCHALSPLRFGLTHELRSMCD